MACRRRRQSRLTPEDLAFLEWLRPILWEIKRDELERLLELPDPPH